MSDRPPRFLRLPEVELRVGLRASQIDHLEKFGRFPKRIKLTGRAIAWLESEIDAWIGERLAESRSAVPALKVGRPAKKPTQTDAAIA